MGQFDNYQARVATTDGNLLASEPAASGASTLFTRMTPAGYTISRMYAGAVQNFPTVRSDLFHVAATDQASDQAGAVLAEESSPSGSRIVQLGLGSTGHQDRPLTVAENAEEPVVSADGRLLAFLRSTHGRSGLWIREMGGRFETDVEREIVGENYDVYEATFLPDDRVIFSSKRSGRFRLYIATQQGEVEDLNSPACSARYPAISLDGHWLAFSCERNGSAQIHVMEWPEGSDFQLTAADCNSISPAWTSDSKRLIYATDCGRGLGLTALAELRVFH